MFERTVDEVTEEYQPPLKAYSLKTTGAGCLKGAQRLTWAIRQAIRTCYQGQKPSVHKYDKPGDAYIGLVHRMDRPVGGLLAFAKTSKAAQRLSEQLREKKLKREYVCVCAGQLPPAFTLRDFLYKDTKSNMVTIVPSYLRKGKGLHAQKSPL